MDERKSAILEILRQTYHGSTTALHYTTAFELLIAVMLSAQCTDVRVNIITSRLFPEFGVPEKIVALGQEGLEEKIRDCGLFRTKARNILSACDMLINEFHGQVPDTYEELIRLPGVGRKTANVVLNQIFRRPAIGVDTHVFRVANRLELAPGRTPREVEEGLMRAIPREDWGDAHHWLIWHGRKICKARRPLCRECPLTEFCPSASDVLESE